MYNSLQEIVDMIEACNFWTQDGIYPLTRNTSFQALKERAREEKELLVEKKSEDSVRDIVVRIEKKCDEIRAALPVEEETVDCMACNDTGEVIIGGKLTLCECRKKKEGRTG